jgi:predicted acyltransferase
VTAPAAPAPPPRLYSIDALRGFDMFWIMGGEELAQALARWWTGSDHNLIHEQLEHVEWNGFRFYDLIFPTFLFLVGVAIPFSLASLRRRGATTADAYWRIGRRVALLFLLGLVYNHVLDFNWSDLRIAGVLQRIAICYGVAAVIAWHTGPRGQLVLFAAALIGYWAIMTFVPVPGGTAGDLTKEGSLAGWLDRHYLPGSIKAEYYGYGDNEGLLSTLPAVGTALLGVLAGQWLRAGRPAGLTAAGLAAAGAACLVAGGLWGQSFPINKILWTSTFVLWAGGWSLLLLALFYGVIDGLGWRTWAFFFVVIGANAIVAYLLPHVVDFEKLSRFFLTGTARAVGGFGPVVLAAGAVALVWLVLYHLYRSKLFLRV